MEKYNILKNGKAIHYPMHPGNPKAILIVQNLLKISIKINNFSLYFLLLLLILLLSLID